MKKTLLFFTIVLSAGSTFGQINKGQWLTGGNGNYSSQKQILKNYYVNGQPVTIPGKNSSSLLSADAGYFVLNGLAGGVRFALSSSRQKTDVSYKYTSWTAAPFVRYYILPSSQKINFFADASYLWGTSANKTVTATSGSTFKSSTHGYSFMAGPAFFLSPSASLELTAGYTGIHDQTKSFTAGIGFKVHLGKGKK